MADKKKITKQEAETMALLKAINASNVATLRGHKKRTASDKKKKTK